MTPDSRSELHERVVEHLKCVYIDTDCDALAHGLLSVMHLNIGYKQPEPDCNNWNQEDIALITYADTLLDEGQKPLQVLHGFANEYLKGLVSIVHILPFFPYSSDDGFSVMDYLAVNESHGDWDDIEAIGREFRLMSDVVLNHMSARSRWFDNFKKRIDPGRDYFFEADKDLDTSQVVRPRASPLLNKVDTADGERYVWCTFSEDQVDLDFSNPKVLEEFVRIIYHYLEHGVRVFRLDAVAFLWKEPGSSCIHLPQTHHLIKVLRLLIEHHSPDAVIITETNVPNRENLTYFGNADEAHVIYNFSLPPLLINTLITGDCGYLKSWMMSMPPAKNGTAYLNFIASHDGVGLRPLDGLLDDTEKSRMIETLQSFGAQVTYRRSREGDKKPYEINITVFDALKGTVKNGPDAYQVDRFVCAHTVMLGLEGIPAFYIHSLLGTENDYARLEHTGRNRSINRSQWQRSDLEAALNGQSTHHGRVFQELKRRITLRQSQPAFHPNATQFTLHLGSAIFGFWRQSIDRSQSIFCLYNINEEPQTVPLESLNLIVTDQWCDLLTNTALVEGQKSLELAPYQAVWLSNYY